MNAAVRAAVVTRADGRCECGCGAPVPPGEVDHFFGRAKSEESVANCWLLTPACHFAKTRNSPSARAWLVKFRAHAELHGYLEAQIRAESKDAWLKAKGMSA